MTRPKLTYFDMPISRGEECRLAFSIAGVEFDDVRLSRAEWLQMKATSPYGQLPLLEIEGRPVLAQANAILLYIGETHGLLPTDAWERARHLGVMGACEDVRVAAAKTFGISDEAELKAARQALAEGPVTTWGKSVEAQIAGTYVGGAEVSVADIKLYMVVGWLEKGVLDHFPAETLKGFKKLQATVKAVGAHPKVVAWQAK